MTKLKYEKQLRRLLALGIPFALALPSTSSGQGDVEWDPQRGYHAQEWYDPSDWFDDDDSIDYEENDLDYDYSYGSPYWDSTVWYDEIGEAGAYGPDYAYGVHYVWSDDQDRWITEYGAYDEAYSYKMNFDDGDMSAANSGSDRNTNANSNNSSNRNRNSDSSSNRWSDSDRRSNSDSNWNANNNNRDDNRSANYNRDNNDNRSWDSDNANRSNNDRSSSSNRNRYSDRSDSDSDWNANNNNNNNNNSDRSWNNNNRENNNNNWDNNNRSSSSSRDRYNALSSKADDAKALKTVRGEIEAFSQMNLRYAGGFDMKHSLARVKLNNGKSAIIDLGYSSLILADLAKGDRVTLLGNKGQINGQNVFIATELQTQDGHSITLERALTFSEDQKLRDARRRDAQMASNRSRSDSSSQQRSMNNNNSQQRSMNNDSSQQDTIVLSGTVEDHQKKRLRTERGERTFVKLRLENGEAATIDLGSDTSLSDLNLSEGDRIRVEGPKKSVDGRSVLVARTISVAGEQVKGG